MDTIIRNCKIIDGSSVNIYKGDIGIIDDYITRVGNLENIKGEIEIDAGGKFVCPGFIDVNSTSSLTILADSSQISKISQGITTEIIGNMGYSPFPFDAEREFEDNLYSKLINSNCSTGEAYLKMVRESKPAINVGFMVGYNSIRNVMSKNNNTFLNNETLEKISEGIKNCINCGYMGISFSLNTLTGNKIDNQEIENIMRLFDSKAHYASFCLNSYGDNIFSSLESIIYLAKKTEIPCHISDFKIMGEDNFDKIDKSLFMLNSARDENIKITGDFSPYASTVGDLTELLPVTLLNNNKLGIYRKLKDPIIKLKIKKQMDYLTKEKLKIFDDILILHCDNTKFKHLTGKTFKEAYYLSTNSGDILDFLFEILLKNSLKIKIIYSNLSEKVQQRFVEQEWMIPSTSSPSVNTTGITTEINIHPRSFSTFPYLLKKYFKEKGDKGLQTIIKKMSFEAAEQANIPNRGRIAPGYHGDILILDTEKLEIQNDFKHPFRISSGIDTVIVNGKIAWTSEIGLIEKAGNLVRSDYFYRRPY